MSRHLDPSILERVRAAGEQRASVPALAEVGAVRPRVDGEAIARGYAVDDIASLIGAATEPVAVAPYRTLFVAPRPLRRRFA